MMYWDSTPLRSISDKAIIGVKQNILLKYLYLKNLGEDIDLEKVEFPDEFPEQEDLVNQAVTKGGRLGSQTDSTNCGFFVVYALIKMIAKNRVYPVFPVVGKDILKVK